MTPEETLEVLFKGRTLAYTRGLGWAWRSDMDGTQSTATLHEIEAVAKGLDTESTWH